MNFSLVLILSFLVSTVAQAQFSCLQQADRHKVGYLLEPGEINILNRPEYLGRNLTKTTVEKVAAVEASINALWKDKVVPNLTSQSLAELIVDVSQTVGVDHQILAAVIRQESGYCQFRWNRRGGDSGCMQITTPALVEMKHQLGLAGEGKFSEGVPEILNILAENYFRTKEMNRLQAYQKWIEQDNESIKKSIRTTSLYDFDILTGALFLKFQLALANGNYGLAVRNYNGSRKKLSYQASVMGNSNKVDEESPASDEQACQDDQGYSVEIQKFACQMTEDPQGCLNGYLRTLPNSI